MLWKKYSTSNFSVSGVNEKKEIPVIFIKTGVLLLIIL
jgi:hypothetical protein